MWRKLRNAVLSARVRRQCDLALESALSARSSSAVRACWWQPKRSTYYTAIVSSMYVVLRPATTVYVSWQQGKNWTEKLSSLLTHKALLKAMVSSLSTVEYQYFVALLTWKKRPDMEKVNRTYFFAALFLGLVGGVAKAGPIKGETNIFSSWEKHLSYSRDSWE